MVFFRCGLQSFSQEFSFESKPNQSPAHLYPIPIFFLKNQPQPPPPQFSAFKHFTQPPIAIASPHHPHRFAKTEVNGSASPWLGRCSVTRRCCCWMSPPQRWIPRVAPWSRRPWSRRRFRFLKQRISEKRGNRIIPVNMT